MQKIQAIVHSDPDILGGVVVFVGTRVPARILFEFLSAGDSLDKFLESYPSVSREQAVALLALAEDTLVGSARPPG